MKYFIVFLAIQASLMQCNNKGKTENYSKSKIVQPDTIIQEQRELLRKYALCSCIINASEDSLHKNDYSRSLYTDQSLYAERSLLFIDSIATEYAKSIQPSKYEAYKGQKAVIYFCTEFYKSDALDSLIRTLDSTIYR